MSSDTQSNAGGEQRALPPHLRSGLDLVFCGANPGLYSASVGHYFAFRGNSFWSLLAQTGITPRLFAPAEDATLLDLGIGLTDVVLRASTGVSNVGNAEWPAGAGRLASELRQHRPAAVCFVGDVAYRAFSGRSRTRWGRQPVLWDGIELFVAPSSSGRASGLAAERRLAFAEVAEWLHDRRCGRDSSA
jgi:TDG/mug DNA glycosylase family protein